MATEEEQKPLTRTEGHVGNEVKVHLSGGRAKIDKRDATYKVVEADDLKASHKVSGGGKFAENEDYVKNVQPRTYSGESAKAVLERADNYEPDQVMNTDVGPNTGPPMVTEDGHVLGGNSRTMTQKHMYDTDRGDAIRDHLTKNAEKFGLNPEEIAKFKNPILVRELKGVHSEGTDSETLNQLASKMNVAEAMGMKQSEAATDLSKRLNEKKIYDRIAESFNLDDHSTINDLHMSGAGKQFKDELKEVFGAKADEYIGKDGKLNTQGRKLVEDALASRVIDDPNLFGRMTGSAGEKLNKIAIPALLISKHGDEHNLDSDLKQSFDAVDKVARYRDGLPSAEQKKFNNMSSEEQLQEALGEKTKDMFAEDHPLTSNSRARTLYHIIQNETPNNLKKIFTGLADSIRQTGDDAQTDLFAGAGGEAAPKTTSEHIVRSYEKTMDQDMPEEYGKP